MSKLILPDTNSIQGDFNQKEPLVEFIAPDLAEKFPFILSLLLIENPPKPQHCAISIFLSPDSKFCVTLGTVITGVTVKVTSSEVAAQLPSAAIVYLITTVVFVLISSGEYTPLLIVPPPETIENVPPVGFPVNVFVSFSVIEAVDVVLSATISQF